MSISKTKDLLGQLAQLERTVSEFSFDELSADDAKILKGSFNTFRASLENHIYKPKKGAVVSHAIKASNDENQEISQKQFIAHISHEIRTPLNSIIGFANLLNDEKLTSGQHKKVDAIQFASNTLLKLINEVLDYSKISSGVSNFETVDFNLHSLLKDVMFLCETLIVDRKIELLVEIDDNVPKIIKGDPSKLSQVLLNLLGNSVKFVEQGFIKLEVFSKASYDNHCVLEFSVADTGIGIAKEKIDTIFKRYTQAEANTSSKYGGTGLGLTITKEIIEKLKGDIEIDSTIDSGTTVTFRLPYTIGKNIGFSKISKKPYKNLKGQHLLAGAEIMVFEDNQMNSLLIVEQLTKWGCKVHANVSLTEGLEILGSSNVDLILMDLKMPNQNGFEVSKIIRTHENNKIKSTPIVAFSADFTEKDSIECKTIGINDFLLKPYSLNDLMTTILKNKKSKVELEDFSSILQKPMIKPKETTVVDLNHLLKDCFGEIDMLNELVKLFKLNAIEFIGNVTIHLKTDNLKEIALSAHKLKAGFAMIKADGMRKLIVDIEASCKANKVEKVKELYEVFLIDYPVLEENLTAELTVMNKK
ncbi:phospho-acceptor domain-containing protein [Maribacter spongiicola]|uniref:histidine kinase n=1 Tax=Maribacter spongiicola TaxID=1206753 RepID=A0A4V3ERH1_9FLAO|nr:ATP-binding protein [Maribacter spongiicola]TDT45178.1 phospho-acceptor domain-containing protein [Maribacter spongiicola]